MPLQLVGCSFFFADDVISFELFALLFAFANFHLALLKLHLAALTRNLLILHIIIGFALLRCTLVHPLPTLSFSCPCSPHRENPEIQEKRRNTIVLKKKNTTSAQGLVWAKSSQCQKRRERKVTLLQAVKTNKPCVSYVAPSTSFASEGPCPSRVGARTQNVPYRNCPGKCLVFPQCDPAHTKPSPAFTPTQALL